MNANLEPQLAPPGAGLPKLELQIARLLFAFKLRTGSRDAFNARFKRERETIQRLMYFLEESDGARRVLIQRPRGLEDSSRYWSVWMTLDHLRIIHNAVIRIITALTEGMALPGQASTAAVKPDPDVTAAIVAGYEQSCDDLLAKVARAGDLNTAARFAHPWFGPLNAAGWHALAAQHLGLHRVQIERIIAGLRASQP